MAENDEDAVLTLLELVRSGDRVGALKQLANKLAEKLDTATSPADVGLLARQLMAVFDQLDSKGPNLAEKREEAMEDELAARRAVGESDSDVRARSRSGRDMERR